MKWPNLPEGYAWLREVAVLPRHVPIALDLIGTVEVPGAGNSPTIMGWNQAMRERGVIVSGYTADSIPWCGWFMAYVMTMAGRETPDKPLWALNWGKFGVDGGQPELGDVLTFVRDGGGHVAIYIAEDAQGFYHVLGGNQSDRVSITRIAKTRMRDCRQPPYQNKPSSVVPHIVQPNGLVSHNEA